MEPEGHGRTNADNDALISDAQAGTGYTKAKRKKKMLFFPGTFDLYLLMKPQPIVNSVPFGIVSESRPYQNKVNEAGSNPPEFIVSCSCS